MADLFAGNKSTPTIPDSPRERPSSVPSDASNPLLANYPDPETGRRTQSRATPDSTTPESAPEARSSNNVPVGRAPGYGVNRSSNNTTAELHSLISRTGPGSQQRSGVTTPSTRSRSGSQSRNRVDTASPKRLMDHQPRRWEVGDVYSPHDLSAAEARKNAIARRPDAGRFTRPPGRNSGPDVFDALTLDPRNSYQNIAMMAGFVTDLGRIKSRKITGLRPRNQRRMAKAVRRAIGIGLIPSAYRHPELMEERKEQKGRFNTGL